MLAEMKVGERINLSDHSFIDRREDGYWNEHNIRIEFGQNPIQPAIWKQMFEPEIHKHIIDSIKAIDFDQNNPFYVDRDDDNFYRIGIHSAPFLVEIHPQLTEVASSIFGEPVKPSYVWLSLYNENGVCPFHTDRPQCKYTIDYCIDQDEEWPIWVDDKAYILLPNDALCFSGTDSPHFRKKITGKYCWLAFFHFVPESFDGRLT